MPQADSFISIVSPVLSIVFTIAVITACVVVVVTCFKALAYFKQKTRTLK